MSDDLESRGHHAITHNGETYIKLADASVTFGLYRKDIAAKDAEIRRLRAELATARREGMEEAAQIADEYAQKTWREWEEAGEDIAAAIRAAAGEVKP
jgi:hypothetical protein